MCQAIQLMRQATYNTDALSKCVQALCRILLGVPNIEGELAASAESALIVCETKQ